MRTRAVDIHTHHKVSGTTTTTTQQQNNTTTQQHKRRQVQFLDTVVDMPVVYNDRGLANSRVPQIPFIARVSGHSCCATETGTQLLAVAVMAAMKGFWEVFQAIFRAPSGDPGV